MHPAPYTPPSAPSPLPPRRRVRVAARQNRRNEARDLALFALFGALAGLAIVGLWLTDSPAELVALVVR